MKKITFPLILILFAVANLYAQPETLTNAMVAEMSKLGLEKSIIVLKIQESKADFDVSVKGLIELRRAGVDNDVIAAMIEKTPKPATDVAKAVEETPVKYSENTPEPPPGPPTPLDALIAAKTVALHKSTVNPSLQAVEKELLKRPEWIKRKLSVIQYRDQADLFIDISFVHFSLITHRYTWRLYDRRSGIVIAAGETTSWGSLAKNIARDIGEKLGKLESK